MIVISLALHDIYLKEVINYCNFYVSLSGSFEVKTSFLQGLHFVSGCDVIDSLSHLLKSGGQLFQVFCFCDKYL